MSWQIDLFRIPLGVDPHVVRDVQHGWEDHYGYAVPDASDDTDHWIEHAIELIETVAPGLKIVEEDGAPVVEVDTHGRVRHLRLWQPAGPLIVNLYPDCVDVRVNTGHPETHEGEWFQALWSACRILAERAECAVFPQYDDDPTDMTMDPKEARDELDWA